MLRSRPWPTSTATRPGRGLISLRWPTPAPASGAGRTSSRPSRGTTTTWFGATVGGCSLAARHGWPASRCPTARDRALLVEQRAQARQRLLAEQRDLAAYIARRQPRLKNAQVDCVTSAADHCVVKPLRELRSVFGRYEPAVRVPMCLQVRGTDRTKSSHLRVQRIERRGTEPHAANQNAGTGATFIGVNIRQCTCALLCLERVVDGPEPEPRGAPHRQGPLCRDDERDRRVCQCSDAGIVGQRSVRAPRERRRDLG